MECDAISGHLRRLAAMPGRRAIVLASPGFATTSDRRRGIAAPINRATRACALTDCLDARGLDAPLGFNVATVNAPGGQAVDVITRRFTSMQQSPPAGVLAEFAAVGGSCGPACAQETQSGAWHG